MIFDTWGGLLSADAYRRFSLAPMRAVLDALAPRPDGRRVPTIVFTKGGAQWLDDIAACGASAVGLDWTADLADARRRVGAKVALQGNLDPLVLLTDPETVARAGAAVVRAAGPAPGHVFNLGHGIVPATRPENVAALVESVHSESRAMRAAS
jgi:uroporphyrinogen decarboxylase